ncbi:L,D-transpeptidase family protein [Clostridium guangxiense]|uniref:L,D-transpeptidase family protein n=1 Tax=Clostridium guangxiense TaxID=1662055 RepID=UPI001E588C1D|nr:L,D-transpeptidase family protein [Clostridium guangxiense]MCD2348581.1 L,D-transpeptidase family protein [Clostridium guangxiense]
MLKFKTIVTSLLIVLLIESICILVFYKSKVNTISNYDPKKKITIIVDISTNTLSVFQNDKIIKNYAVASGKATTPSPIGTWTIVHKDTWGESFGGRWMGFNVPWGQYGIHGTSAPSSIGWASSHGCIRMRNKDVVELYKITPIGTKVIVAGSPYTNFSSSQRTLKPGMRGSDVYDLQVILKDKGYYKGNADGIYGDGMKYYVHKFQKDNELYVSDTISSNFFKKLGIKLMD